MTDLADGESAQVQGSGSSVYTIRNIGGVYSCSCPAWRNQSIAIETRTCKHIRKLRGDAEEVARVGAAAASPPRAKKGSDDGSGAKEPPILLADSWDGVVDVKDWWISEKLDGVRAYWDGQQFLSRQGNRYVAPDWFVEGLPKTPLDGELWLNRKQFQRTVSIVRRQDQSDHWKEIRFVVFDAPSISFPFEDRMEELKELLRKHRNEFAAIHQQLRCKGIQHLRDELQRVEALGGEGLMLRQPASLYVAGRSSTLLKVKTFHDAEATVIGHQAGAGRHKGRLGALLVQLPDGTEFAVGTGFSDAQRDNPPAVGSSITFRYQELSDGGVPRFPSYVGVRSDLAGTSKKIKSDKDQVALSSKKESTQGTKKKPIAEPEAIKSKPSKSSAITTRHFTFADGKSDKFWEVNVQDTVVTVRYGRSGMNGQTNTKEFPDEAAAQKHADGLIAEKTKKGYVEA